MDWRIIDRYPKARQLQNIRVLRLDEALTFVNADYVKGQLIQEARKMEKEAASRKANASANDLTSLAVVPSSLAATTTGDKDDKSQSKKPRIGLFIVIVASGINFIDLSGLRALADVSKDLKEHGVRLLVARAKHGFRDTLRLHEKLFHDLGGEKVYLSLEQLVVLLEHHDMRHGPSPTLEMQSGVVIPSGAAHLGPDNTSSDREGLAAQGVGDAGSRVDVVVVGTQQGAASAGPKEEDLAHRANIV